MPKRCRLVTSTCGALRSSDFTENNVVIRRRGSLTHCRAHRVPSSNSGAARGSTKPARRSTAAPTTSFRRRSIAFLRVGRHPDFGLSFVVSQRLRRSLLSGGFPRLVIAGAVTVLLFAPKPAPPTSDHRPPTTGH